MDKGGVLVVAEERIPPGIEQASEACPKVHDNDGVHCLAHLWSKLSHAARTAGAKSRRANANFNVGAQLWMGVSSVSCDVDDGNLWGPGGDVVGFACGQGKRAI